MTDGDAPALPLHRARDDGKGLRNGR